MLKNLMRLLRAHLKPFFVHLTTVIRKVRDERERNQLTRTLIWPSINRRKEERRRGSGASSVCSDPTHFLITTPLHSGVRVAEAYHSSSSLHLVETNSRPSFPLLTYMALPSERASDCNVSCRRPNEQHKTERLEEARAGGALSQSEGEQYVFEH